jgi:hypothetical protein
VSRVTTISGISLVSGATTVSGTTSVSGAETVSGTTSLSLFAWKNRPFLGVGVNCNGSTVLAGNQLLNMNFENCSN